jgi:NADH:ubiquinone oxidoreductase subunit F (NADH-binding)/NADH:ubiquinone oxidoreductase subunit E
MGRLIDALEEQQHERGWLDREGLEALAERLRVPLYRLEELVSFYPHFRREPPKRVTLRVCRDVACFMAGSSEHRARLEALCARHADVEHLAASCLGRCDTAPAATLGDVPVCTADLDALGELLARPPVLAPAPPTGRRWQCDPYARPEERYGTARALVRAGFDAASVIATLEASGLRGMGGAGFPTGTKWKMVRAQPPGERYVVCNADESEPGTFKDRVILAELAHLVIEGMLLAGLTTGAEEGIVFIRHEYAPERLRLERAIAEARAAGVLGPDALGSGRHFDVRVTVSPGGYILGEETALIECLEDKRGEPRNKPPFPGEHGLFGKPTLINNVETFAFVPMVLREGAEAWRARGTRGATGLKLIALAGDVVRPGVYEVPMGTTIGELVAMGGGARGPVLAVAPGGASSNFVGEGALELALDFKALADAGTMLGSGAVLVVCEGRDLFALATNLVAFFRNESCGKCVPCRVGSEKAVRILEEAVAGRGSRRHLALLPALHRTMAETSICGLGQVALNPFLSVLRAFGTEIGARFTEE